MQSHLIASIGHTIRLAIVKFWVFHPRKNGSYSASFTFVALEKDMVHCGSLWQGMLVFWFFCCACCAQQSPSLIENESAVRAKRIYREADARFKKEPKNVESAWQFGRACFDAAEFSTNSTERAQIAEQGIAACKQALVLNRDSAAAHYYLGINIGELAQTRGLGALKLVDQMEHEFELARTLDERLDYAGPDRNLGILYRDAPAWISVGSKSKARKHLIHAVELAPNYPENRLNLAEGYAKWSDRAGVRREYKAMAELWPKARTNFVGAAWSSSWIDWEQRLKELKKKVEEPSKSLESPRQKSDVDR
jgi:tetratricopeptide (TPR) repeat protein